MGKQLLLEILFKDGSKITLHPIGGEADRVIREFTSGGKKLEIETIEGGPNKAVFSTVDIRAIIPRWISGD